MNQKFLSRVLCQPWAMRPLELSALTQIIISPTLDSSVAAQKKDKKPSAAARKITAGDRAAASAATVIPVWGILGRGWEEYEKYYFGAVDVDDLIAEIEATPAGSMVILWFRSPGGIITGIAEMAAYLRAAGKRRQIIAFTDDLCCSAAYWLASQCQMIVATPSAMVGSIGVYIAFYDWTKFLEQQGIALELFKAGRMKAMGLTGNPLSDEESAHLQASVDQSYADFTSDVLRNREIDPETMQGQSFSGGETLARNLVDKQLPSYAALISAAASGKLGV